MVKSWRQGLEYGLVCVVASAACAGIIGWGVDLLGLLPFILLAPAIFFNNVVMGLLLGPPLLGFLYPRVKRWQLRYEDIRQSIVSLKHSNHSRKHASAVNELPKVLSDVQGHIPLLNCQELSFYYPSQTTSALQNVSFSLEPGELVMLLGRSGSGKSTLCYACNGLIPHFIPGKFLGVLQVCGEDTCVSPVWNRAACVGLVFQDFETQLIGTTVEAELLHPLEYRTPPLVGHEIERRMAQALRRVGVEYCLAGLTRGPWPSSDRSLPHQDRWSVHRKPTQRVA